MARTIKALANGLSVVLVSPMVVLYRFLAWGVRSRRDELFQTFTQALSLVPGLPGSYLRRAFLVFTADRCTFDCTIGFGTIFASPTVRVEEGVYVGPYCSIGHVAIGRDSMLGTGVHLLGGGRAHRIGSVDIPMRFQGSEVVPIRVGRDCWIGNGAIVMADVEEHAVVGAGAVVTKRVGAWHIVAGNPARILRDRRSGAQTGGERGVREGAPGSGSSEVG